MKRILLDTNIYEFILRYLERKDVKSYIEKQIFIIYGFDAIRKELRGTPKKKVEAGREEIKNLRMALLLVYDFLVGKHQYKTTDGIINLAGKYFDVYKALGGFASRSEIISDLRIVACASLHNLDIVVSEDNKTMLSGQAISAYKSVNALEKIKTPNFIGFKEFRNLLGGVSLD